MAANEYVAQFSDTKPMINVPEAELPVTLPLMLSDPACLADGQGVNVIGSDGRVVATLFIHPEHERPLP